MILILGQDFFLSKLSVFYSAKYLIDIRVGELVGVIVCVNRSACVALNTMSVNRVHLNKISPSIQSSQNYTARLPSQEKPLEISLCFPSIPQAQPSSMKRVVLIIILRAQFTHCTLLLH